MNNIDERTGKPKIILDLCGGTGAWSRPYKEAGYDVRLITLPEYDVCTYLPPENVYGILAAPPCTEFSVAKGSKPRDFESALKVVDACLKIIWQCRAFGELRFWAMENPRGFLRQFLGIPKYTFEQWQFGELKIKSTDIWGYFNKPTQRVRIKPTTVQTSIGHKANGRDWAKLVCPDEYKQLNLGRAALRAITPAGFAERSIKPISKGGLYAKGL
jgi:hypothetical protein